MKMKILSPQFNQREQEIYRGLVTQVIPEPLSENKLGILLVRVGYNEGWPFLREIEQTETELNHSLKNGASDFEINLLKESIYVKSMLFKACIRESWSQICEQ